MTRTLLIVGLAIIPITGLIAEEQPAIDLEARKASVANLEAHITQREKRLAEWGKDIVELDARKRSLHVWASRATTTGCLTQTGYAVHSQNALGGVRFSIPQPTTVALRRRGRQA